MWRVTLRGLVAHRFRLALTVLAIVLGVGFVAGTFMFTDTLNNMFDELFTEANEGVDVIVRAETSFTSSGPGTGGFGDSEPVSERLLEKVRRVEGVTQAEGFVMGFAQIVDPDGDAIAPQGPPTLGVSWGRESLSSLVLREGRKPRGGGEVAVDARTARDNDLKVGDRVTILSLEEPERFRIVGIAGFGVADSLGGSTLAAFDLRTAQRLMGEDDELTWIDVAGEEGVAAVDLRERIAKVLPKDVEAATATRVAKEQSASIKDALGFLNTALLVFAAVALFVGAFIIYNTFNILVTQRTRELALLRTLGASTRQVTVSVMVEALLVGAVSSALGLGVGILMAYGLRGLLDAFGISLPSADLRLVPRTVVVAVVVGGVVTLVSAVLPARRASRVPPIAALRDVEPVRPVSLHRRALAGVAVTGAGAALLAAGLAGVGPALTLVGVGVAVTFIGVTALSPLVSRRLSSWIGAPLPRAFGVPGKLGRENSMRNPRRTAATSAALMVGMALVATFAILGQSVKASARAAIEDSYRADLVLMVNNGISPISPQVARELRDREALGVVSRIRVGVWREPGSKAIRFVTAVEGGTVENVLKLDVLSGGTRGLDRNGVLVHEDVAEDEELRTGDAFRMEFPSGTERMRVAGVYAENRIVGDYVLGLEAYDANYSGKVDQYLMVNAARGITVREARRAVERVLEDFPSVDVRDQTEMRDNQEEQIDRLLGLITALLALAILIALLGIVNTLALSVFERTRELGLLRAVGLSRRQTRAMIRWESVIIALFGGLLGLGVGSFFGWALVTALADEGITDLAFPFGRVAAFLALAGLAGVVAAMLPARRAARLNVLEAIATE